MKHLLTSSNPLKGLLVKALLVFHFWLFCASVAVAQAVDSVAIHLVDSLIKVSNALIDKNDLVQALEVNTAAEKIILEKLGRESASFGSCAYTYGRVFYFKGDFPKSEKWYLDAMAIRKKVLGAEHPDYARSLNNTGLLYMKMGKFETAEPLLLETKSIQEKVLGKEHLENASCLTNLCFLYWQMDKFEKAEQFILDAIAIQIKMLGKSHPDYANSLGFLAVLNLDMSKYEKAELFFLEAKDIQEKALGKESREYALSLSNLSSLYSEIGSYDKAEQIQLEAMAIREKALGKEHRDYAISVNNMGLLYMKMGKFEKSEPLLIEALAIRENVLGKEHPEYAQSLNNLALMYREMGNYEKAEPLYLQSIAIRGKVLGKEHRDYAVSLNNLAHLYTEMGNYEKAEQLFFEVKDFWEKFWGKAHINYYHSLNGLAHLYEKQSKFSASEPLLAEGSALRQERLSGAAAFLSEQEISKYAGTFQKRGDEVNAFLFARSPGETGTLPSLAFDHALFHKGFLLTAAARLHALSAAFPEAEEINNRLKSYHRSLAKVYAKPIAARVGVEELEAKANAAEKELARIVVGYGEAMRQVKWQEVQAVLKQNEAAIEFIHFRVHFPIKTDSIMYAALVLLPGAEQPKFIPLFEEKQLAAAFTPESKEMPGDLLAQIYSRGVKPLNKTEFRGLYELIWQPLDPLLKKANTVYFSPSGLLHRINLGAIPIGKEEVLADRYRLVELGSTRQVVVPLEVKNVVDYALLFGGIQYDLDTTATQQDTMAREMPAAGSSELSFTYSDRSAPQREENWQYLPGTEKEVASIRSLLDKSKFSVQVCSGENATEESFKAISRSKTSPRILHLATHGFFFPDSKTEVSTKSAGREREPAFKMSDHPMIRSGLILAGGNHAWQTGNPMRPGMEDGILTAYEISQMNLSNTELVVLSACETGLGDIQGNEGVYGLQRAFKIAGVKFLIMSLWQVPDQETAVFMTAFYKHWLEGELDIPDAFRKAQRELREAGLAPHQWAGFVLVE